LLKFQDVVKLTIGFVLGIGWIVWHYMFIDILAWIIVFFFRKRVLFRYKYCMCNMCLGEVVNLMLNTFVMLNIAKSMEKFKN
jgi:hypothetical protein